MGAVSSKVGAYHHNFLLLGPAKWRVEQEVQEALQENPAPRDCLLDRSSVLQWGHSSKVACHPGSLRTLISSNKISGGHRWLWTPKSLSKPVPSVPTASPITEHQLASFVLCLFLKAPGLTLVLGSLNQKVTPLYEQSLTALVKPFIFVPLTKLPSVSEMVNLLALQCLHGMPHNIVSDCGPQFASHVWKAFCQALGASATLFSEYHPQTNRII